MSVTPEASCLELHVANGSGDFPSTGCVDRVLYGENRRSQPLLLPADATTDSTGLVVEPGGSFTYEVWLDHCEATGDNYHAAIDATLGSDPIRIEFDLYAP